MPKSDVVTKDISNSSMNSPKGGTSSVKASHWRNVKDSLSDLWSPDSMDLLLPYFCSVTQNLKI